MIEYELKQYLQSATGLKPTPAFSVGSFPAIAYTLSPVSDGPIKTSQLEVRVMGEVMEECLEIREKIIKALHTNEQEPSIVAGKYAIRGQVSGGGWLFNSVTQMWEYPTIFTLTWRCI